VKAGATDVEPPMRRPEPLMRKAGAADVEVLGSKGGGTVRRDSAMGELKEPEVNPIEGEKEEDANAEKRKRNSRNRREALAAVAGRTEPLMRRPEPLLRRPEPLMWKPGPLLRKPEPPIRRLEPLMPRPEPLMRRQ